MSNVASIAHDIERVCVGRDTAEVYAAISMVIGASAAGAERPDLDGLLFLIGKAAQEEFNRRTIRDTTH